MQKWATGKGNRQALINFHFPFPPQMWSRDGVLQTVFEKFHEKYIDTSHPFFFIKPCQVMLGEEMIAAVCGDVFLVTVDIVIEQRSQKIDMS